MQVTIAGHNYKISDQFKDEIESGLDRLSEPSVPLQYADVIVEKEKSGFKFELKLGVDHHAPVVVHANHEKVHYAMDDVMHKVKRAVRHLKHDHHKNQH